LRDIISSTRTLDGSEPFAHSADRHVAVLTTFEFSKRVLAKFGTGEGHCVGADEAILAGEA
jgi:hypothetical protein